MKRLFIIIILALIVTGAYAVVKKVMLKCNADSYVAQLSPDTNYGTASELIAQISFTYNGTTYTDVNNKIAYLHYAFPSEMVGKVTVLGARCYFWMNYYKGKSPYQPGEAIYTIGLYPCLSSWDEYTITHNNQPISSGPAFFEISNTKNTFQQAGFNHFEVDQYGLSKLQEAVDTGISYGMAWYVDVTSPTGSETLLAGDYLHLMSIASRETGRKMSYISMGYDIKTGNLINGSNISPSTLGEVKALYH